MHHIIYAHHVCTLHKPGHAYFFLCLLTILFSHPYDTHTQYRHIFFMVGGYSRCWPLSTFLFDGSKGRRILSTSSSPTGAAGLLAGLTVGLIVVLFGFGERGLSILLFPNKWKTSKHVLAGAFILLHWNWLNQIMENYSSTIRAFRYYIYIYLFLYAEREGNFLVSNGVVLFGNPSMFWFLFVDSFETGAPGSPLSNYG